MFDWHYFDVTHSLHTLYNPLSTARVDELGRLIQLGPETRVLDIASGAGEMLVRWYEQHGISGVGVDLSPPFIERAERRKRARAPDADIRFVHMSGEAFHTDERFDVVMCVGASWIWKGYVPTLRALRRFARPGGILVSGEPYWIGEPPAEYLAAEGLGRDEFHTLEGCREEALKEGLDVVWMARSSAEEWDRYEMLQNAAVDRFARKHPDHEDLEEIRARRRNLDESYVRWGRKCCGWALWAFRVPS